MRSQVDTLCSVDTHAWDAYVGQCAQATHYHLSAWGRIIARVYGYPCLYLTAWDGEALCGIVPVVIIGGLFRRPRFVSMPYLDYGGICADTPEIAQHLYRALQRVSTERQAGLLDLRQRGATALPLTPYGDKVTMVLRLAPEPEHMWKAFGAKLRNQIRKAEKAHVQTQWAGIDGLQDFYHVYVQNMRDLGSPPHSRRFFRSIMEAFPAARLLLVRAHTQVIGGALCLVFQDTMLVPWASALRPYFHLCPNNLLYWEAIRAACTQGLHRFDFGRSSRGSGTYNFKKQWGAREESLHWLANVRGGDLLSAERHRVLQGVVEAWKHLPLGATRLIGPFLRKRLSN